MNIMSKRLFDIFFSFSGLLIIWPILLFLAILIKRDSPGPVFYRGVRVGRQGKEFKIFKFRTMVENAEKLGGPSTAGDDPRLTKIGNFLKKYQLDELPQLINVLRDEMSLAGPRPEVKMYVDMMAEEERKIILSIKPGMTDLASLWNFHESEVLKGSLDPEKTYMEKIRPEKIRLQLEYVKNRSFMLDLRIVIKTILKVFYG
ncbi:MAG: sugar transferase [Candidatus Wildermuthbacteria bacterium]|nr:sugar transferase [Candidatus Wildermuthbacteria bacterium]